jgi:hypothetical protein
VYTQSLGFFGATGRSSVFPLKIRMTSFLRETGQKPIHGHVKGHIQNPHRQFIRKTGRKPIHGHVLDRNPLNIVYRRSLTGNKWERWLHLVSRLMAVSLSYEQDKFVWCLTTSGVFTVKSIYLDYMNVHTKYLKKYIWKMKVPLKIKIFMWFFH